MKRFLISTFICLSPAMVRAELDHWKSQLEFGGPGNYDCYPVQCTEAQPANDSVNCKNLREITFAYAALKNFPEPGYVWISYNPDGPTHEDWLLKRDFTTDGSFHEMGFRGEGVLKNSEMGTAGYVSYKSFAIDLLPPNGAMATWILDYGGKSPLKADLKCCTPGMECREEGLQE